MELDNTFIDKIINRLLENEKYKKVLEEKLQMSTIDLLQHASCETCFNLLFNKSNKLFFNKSEKLYMLERILESEELSEILSTKNLNPFPLYLLAPLCRGIIEKYPDKIINLINNNSRFEYYIDKCGFTAKEKEYISSIVILNKLN